jgi:hypothetical protein
MRSNMQTLSGRHGPISLVAFGRMNQKKKRTFGPHTLRSDLGTPGEPKGIAQVMIVTGMTHHLGHPIGVVVGEMLAGRKALHNTRWLAERLQHITDQRGSGHEGARVARAQRASRVVSRAGPPHSGREALGYP